MIVESAFGNLSRLGHLTAFETGSDAAAASRPLTLMTFTRGLAESGTDTATESFGGGSRTFRGT